MTDLVRAEVCRIAPYNAGLTIAEVREKYNVATITKLGSNENPIGPSPHVTQALRDTGALCALYPDPAGRSLRAALAHKLGVEAERVILGNGSEDLLSVVSRTVLRPGDKVVTPYPSFPLHEDYATLMGAKVVRVPVTSDFAMDIDRMLVAAQGARMLVLSNPMNPVGTWIDNGALARLVAGLPETCLLVLDEAYFEYARGGGYADGLDVLRGMDRPWIVLRTFSKAYGLAGLRVGYGVTGDLRLHDMMDRVRTPFNVNAAAQTAALAAWADEDHLARVVELATTERARMADLLRAKGYAYAPSRGNFLFVDCGTSSIALAETLLRQGVIVKPWKQPGYDRFIRISVGNSEDTLRLGDALPAHEAAGQA
ncbi:histidinol-phosphate aminotransferase [Novosphingobium nitrogenifigens DSM 19370]|uniref:Histidinol-phosphate aminotransferase n=1 Tax=Novosphingobium nitrogenifigens DSM 19370 TaxID=983920 RepID=F1ZBU7_9SPHN|nr:histidinol-phosphate transaminase [Novosphingobium nitrogenifigens]EGD57977.1 histidinol-phosphate aminotransferase [Novosphingobium nitrogenifigens DSM 19370]